jgi:NAD(P)-dependent dehydrogenase (short-subunit alcohol dehydrogenase family)
VSESRDATEAALVFGAGPGLGMALARCFAAAGMPTGIVARSGDRTAEWARELSAAGVAARGYACDVTSEKDVAAVFARAHADLGRPSLVVYNAGIYMPGQVTDIRAADFEQCWRVGCFGGFLVGREAAKAMLEQGGGTLIFTGATASLRGGAGFANLAVGKFGLRALAQSMARELDPRGVHVAHVIIDGLIGAGSQEGAAPDSRLDPAAIASNYLNLHRQPRSAWTQELDLRPWTEKF